MTLQDELTSHMQHLPPSLRVASERLAPAMRRFKGPDIPTHGATFNHNPQITGDALNQRFAQAVTTLGSQAGHYTGLRGGQITPLTVWPARDLYRMAQRLDYGKAGKYYAVPPQGVQALKTATVRGGRTLRYSDITSG